MSSNAFKRAAEKQKKTAGGEVEELKAGLENIQEQTSPVPQEQEIGHEEVKVETVPVASETEEKTSAEKDLVAIYEAKKKLEPEPRSVRFQLVVTQSTSDKLNALMKQGKIKSKNDLINFLLERYFEGVDWQA